MVGLGATEGFVLPGRNGNSHFEVGGENPQIEDRKKVVRLPQTAEQLRIFRREYDDAIKAVDEKLRARASQTEVGNL